MSDLEEHEAQPSARNSEAGCSSTMDTPGEATFVQPVTTYCRPRNPFRSNVVSSEAVARLHRRLQKEEERVKGAHDFERMHQSIRDWHSRMLERQTPTLVEIPPWNQACFKYIWRGTFDEALDVSEIQALLALILSMLVNIVTVYINLFRSSTHYDFESTRIVSYCVFATEFAVVHILLLLIVAIIVQTMIQRHFTIGVAIDIMELSLGMANFSALMSARVFSPNVFLYSVLPFIIEAKRPIHFVRAAAVVFLWLCLCVVAALTVVFKVSQVGFIAVEPLGEWSISQYLLVVGLLLNVAKVDQSYAMVSQTLLQSVHEHYVGPGEPVNEKRDESTSFYTKLLKCCGIERMGYYMFFAEVFSYHFGEDNDDDAVERMTTAQQMSKMLNFMSFVAKLDNRMLLQYLQMTESPQLHYLIAKDLFEDAREREDYATMEMAVWQADPLGPEADKLFTRNPKPFEVRYLCTNV